jgi:hypothetical protein
VPVRSLISIVLILMTTCSSVPVPTPTDSGIVGNVTIGPMCPVVQIGHPCPDKPYQAKLTVLLSTDRSTVLRFQTDSDGSFRSFLASGDYILQPESPGAIPHAAEIPFIVHAHQFTRLDVTYDSGIR